MPDGVDQTGASHAADVGRVAAVFAVDPSGLGGVLLRGRLGAARDSWLHLLQRLLPKEVYLRRIPPHITDDRLIGGLDLATTLAAGRPMVERGVLAAADGGVLLIPSVERLSPAAAARIASVIDNGEVVLERDGLHQRDATRFGIVAFDEGQGEEEAPPAILCDRLACHICLDDVRASDIATAFTSDEVAVASARLAGIAVDLDAIEALCASAAALGIASLNAPLLASRIARCSAALSGCDRIRDEDLTFAARIALAPRARVVPALQEEEDEPEPSEAETDDAESEQESEAREGPLEDVVLAAAQAAIPPDLLARLTGSSAARARGLTTSGSGARQRTLRRGRPAGTRRGGLRSGARLNVLETLRAAAPWQRIRAQAHGDRATERSRRIEVRPDDFRVLRFKDRRETVTVFVVDASGSSALHRLAEAKGAVELLLADCYIRRDQVALLSFGGRGAELLLPPTRSLTRARRRLADLPGGGGTPLAEALEQAALLVQTIKQRRQTPAVVILTDGQPNLSRDGSSGREAAQNDALQAARGLREFGVAALLIDTSPRAQPCAARIAEAMGAQYVPLPYADARALSDEVKNRIGS